MDEGTVTRWINEFKAGDEQAAQRLWERYYTALVAYARRKIPRHRARVSDEEDVVVCAFNSFFAGVQNDRFPQLGNREDLWRILLLITARKAIHQVEYDRRQKRGEGRVVGESAIIGAHDPATSGHIEQVIGDEPTPEFSALVAEEYAQLLGRLDDATARALVPLKLEGYTNKDIAERLNCSVRTVERKLWLIRTKWSESTAGNDCCISQQEHVRSFPSKHLR